MSDCRTFAEKLPAYLEGAVPEAERREIERHLAACGLCRAALQDLKKTGEILAGLEEQEPPPWFSKRVMARVREEAQPKKGLIQKLFFPLRIKVPLELMASLLVAVLAWQVYQAFPPEMKKLPEVPPSAPLRHRESVTKDMEKGLPAGAPPATRKKTEQGPSRAKPEGQAEPVASRAEEVKAQEEAIPAGGAPAAKASLAEEKKAAAEDQVETVAPAAAPMAKSAPAEGKPAPAPLLQAAPRRMERELKEKDETRPSGIFRDKARVTGKGAPEPQPPFFTVRVRESAPALKTVRELLRQAGAEDIRVETKDGREVISGVIRTGDLDLLAGQLKALGEVSPQEVPAPVLQEVRIRIEIVPVNP